TSRRKRANCGDATARFAYWCATNEADALERPMRRASSRGPEVSHVTQAANHIEPFAPFEYAAGGSGQAARAEAGTARADDAAAPADAPRAHKPPLRPAQASSSTRSSLRSHLSLGRGSEKA